VEDHDLPAPPKRVASPKKPYRLSEACENEIVQSFRWTGPTAYEERKCRKRALEHFQVCPKCQETDQVYWDLDSSDDRFMDWCNLLWSHGVVYPKALYKVVRFKTPIASWTEWRKNHKGDEVEALMLYFQEYDQRPKKTTHELGSEIWEKPGLIKTLERV
jgi:hypothetical protein